MKSIRRAMRLTGGLTLAMMLGACGDSSGPTSVTTTTTTLPPMRTVVDSGEGSLPARNAVRIIFATPRNGTLDITVDWTFAASPIGIYVVREACSLEHSTPAPAIS